MEKEKCLRCGHEWIKRTDAPVVCPGCHSPYWDKKKSSDVRKEMNDNE